MRLFSWFILRRLRLEPLRTATTVAGIALGVAVVVAIRLTNASSLAGFQTALTTISGRTSLEVVGSSSLGVDETLIPDLLWLEEMGEVAPVVEGDVVFRQTGRPPETLRVLGIDILRDRPFRDYRLATGATDDPRPQDLLSLLLDPASSIFTAKFAGPRGIGVGSSVEVASGDRRVPLAVRALLKDEGPARVLDGNFVLMDIAAAQHALNRFGRVSRIEVRLREGVATSTAESDIASRLPAGLRVQRPASRGRQVESMLAAFHLNLTALSYVALLVGLFLVYNTVSVAVLSRREEIGTLRALGASTTRVRSLFLAEAAALAVLGAGFGVILGRLLATGAVALTSTAVTALYIAGAARPPALEPRHVILAFAIAVPLSLLAALVPAQEAARVPPATALRSADRQNARHASPLTRLWLPVALLSLALWLATLGPVNGLPLFGYLSALATVFGASFLVPSTLTLVVRAIERPVRRVLRVEDWLAVSNLSASVPRVSISVAALAVSLSMMVAVAILIGSFRQTVVYWVGQTLQADLFVSPGARSRPDIDETLSPEVVESIASSPDVKAIDRFRIAEVPFGEAGVRVGGGDFQVILDHGNLLFKEPSSARTAMREAIGHEAVVASEAFSIKHRKRAGDRVELRTDRGAATFTIAAVYYDYSNDRGVLMMDRTTFERHFGIRPPTGVTVYLNDSVDPDAARQRLLARIGDTHSVFINTNSSLRREVMRIFDSTFAITWALEVIAIVVAILGVSGTLLTLILERAGDIGVLRLIGTGRRQVRRMVIGEAIVIGAVSQAIGLIVGFALSLIVIYVINVQSFGWTIQFHLPIAFLLQSSVFLVAATAAAGLYPARRAVALNSRPAE